MTPDETPEEKAARTADYVERRHAMREQWCAEVNAVVASYSPFVFGRSAGGFESGQFLMEACACYSSGLFLAALTCAHATCERELAGRVAHRAAEAPRGWERWGLGRLIQHARGHGWNNDETLNLLSVVNEKRRTVYHFRDFSAEEGLLNRTYERRLWREKHDLRSDMTDQLRLDALEAIRAALAVREDDG